MSMEERFDSLIMRHEELAALMSTGDLEPSEFTALSVEYAELSPIVEKVQSLKAARSELEDLVELSVDGDLEMKELAETEARVLKAKLPDLEQELRVMTNLIEPAMIIFMAVGVGGLLFSILQALFAITQRMSV